MYDKLNIEIAEWLVAEGTANTSNGSWIVYFDEVADMFDLSYAEVQERAKDIVDYMDSQCEEILSETWIDDDAFDMNFGLAYCTALDDEWNVA